MTEKQKAELVQAAQVAGARDDAFNQFLADAFAEAERILQESGETTPKVESRLTVGRRDDIV